MPIIIFWVLFAIIVGAIAGSRGRSAVGWFLFSILLSPLLGILFVALAPSRKPVEVIAAPARPDPTTQIRELAALRDSGALTTAEFEAKKAELLARV